MRERENAREGTRARREREKNRDEIGGRERTGMAREVTLTRSERWLGAALKTLI